jgi:hypothetical protein
MTFLNQEIDIVFETPAKLVAGAQLIYKTLKIMSEAGNMQEKLSVQAVSTGQR